MQNRNMLAATILLELAYCGLLPTAQALLPPPAPDGAYPGFNTAEGQNALFNLTSGVYNTALGANTLNSDTTGGGNTALGLNVLHNNVTGGFNTAVGVNALFSSAGDNNCAVGSYALFLNTASGNSAFGWAALALNTIGIGNTATGYQALLDNTDGIRNTANGVYALNHNDHGGGNTAMGYQALANSNANSDTAIGNDSLVSNTTGFENTAVGASSLASNVTGQDNTACGAGALAHNIGNFNNAFGRNALVSHTNGDGNVAVGDSALSNDTVGLNNTAIGNSTLLNNIGGSSNIALGIFAGQNITGGNNIDIGAFVTGPGGEDNTIRIGNNNHIQTFVAGIWNQIGGTQAVYVDTDGRLGLQISSQRFKDEIKPMDQASEIIYRLKPVSFRYKAEIDATRALSFGLIAEDVGRISPDLVIRGRDGSVNSVRYDAVNAMLLNEFLKEHKKVEHQQASIARLESTVARQQDEFRAAIAQHQKKMETVFADLKEQAAQMQKVSAQVEANKSAPRVVLSNK